MHEFWLKDKLILLIGLFQFGLILIVMTVVNLIKLILRKQNIVDTNSPNEIKPAAIALSDFSDELTNQGQNELKDAVSNASNNELSHDPAQVNLSESDRIDSLEQDQPEVSDPNYDLNYKVEIAPELLTELKEISDDPAAVIDEAIRWWLRRRMLDVLDASDDRPDRLGMRSNKLKRSAKDMWND